MFGAGEAKYIKVNEPSGFFWLDIVVAPASYNPNLHWRDKAREKAAAMYWPAARVMKGEETRKLASNKLFIVAVPVIRARKQSFNFILDLIMSLV